MSKQQLLKELSVYPDSAEIQVWDDIGGSYHNITTIEPHALKDGQVVICFEEDDS